ncbi:head maturation protease, ClpP-related [Escherichia coli]|uniref:head maturation protease, ClpP-related n=1 Tax=Escherichia coli TaxID=562 RepID=UPI0003EE5EE4|nr:head maturation protease, ClpP-related [Escherichia coli]
MNRWYTIKAADVRGAADISIYEEIGGFGVTAKQFAEDLKALGDVSHINLRIHSPGGDVFEGIAIYNLLRNHPADITVYIDGVAASMASVVAMAGDRVVMPENAMMMIHYPSHYLMGTHEEPYSFINLLLIMKKEGKRLARTVLIFTERSDQLSRATDRVPGLPANPGYAQ